jgi:hypothetical protein
MINQLKNLPLGSVIALRREVAGNLTMAPEIGIHKQKGILISKPNEIQRWHVLKRETYLEIPNKRSPH